MSNKNSTLFFVVHLAISAIASCIYLFINPTIYSYSIIGLGLFTFFALQFHSKLGSEVPIRELIICIALLQWIIAPVLSYHYFTESDFYYMIIPEERYMNFIVPATICFIVGLMFPIYTQKKREQGDLFISKKSTQVDNAGYYIKRGRIIFGVGIFAFLIKANVPASVGYLFQLLSYCSIVGAFYMIQGRARFNILYLIAALVPIFVSAAKTSVFHEFFLWGGFIVIVYTFIRKSNVLQKSALLVAAAGLIFAINSIKRDYRESIASFDLERNDDQNKTQNHLKQWKEQHKVSEFRGEGKYNEQDGNVSQFFELVRYKFLSDETSTNVTKSGFNQEFIDRLNQGWIIARIMFMVPQYENFADGETIVEGIKAALVPRILAPNKAGSGGKVNFERFTGLSLGGASMNLGLIGEAYANYGVTGGMVFMFVYGLFFSFIFSIILNASIKAKDFIFWIPFVFFYVIKAEEDFTTMFNQFVKSLMVMGGVMYLLKMNIKDEPFVTKDRPKADILPHS